MTVRQLEVFTLGGLFLWISRACANALDRSATVERTRKEEPTLLKHGVPAARWRRIPRRQAARFAPIDP